MKFYSISILLQLILLLSVIGCNNRRTMLSKSESKHENPTVSITDAGWKSLTTRQKIGQLMLMLPDRQKELDLGDGSLKTYFKRYPVTGYFMGWKLWDGVDRENYLSHIRKTCKEYQDASELPLIFQEDYENGVTIPGMTQFPAEMALGAANSEKLAYQFGEIVAKECRSVGINWVLHPVADLNINPFNPVTNTRSISDDPDKAIQLLSSQIKGLLDNGVAATIKHFPGDGIDFRDQHLLTTCNSLSFDVWEEKYGRVFKTLIDSGVTAIMPGHITLPSYQKEKIDGRYLPATLSKELLIDLLKGKLGFEGVVISDAMVMGGFRGWYESELEGEINSFLAGVDMMLWPSYEFMDSLEARINRKEIPLNRLDNAVRRVWNLKKRMGLLDKNRQLIVELSKEEKVAGQEVAKQICEKAITLVRDRDNRLPLVKGNDSRILIIGMTPIARKGGDGALNGIVEFSKKMEEKGFDVDFIHNYQYESIGWNDTITSKYDRIIAVVDRHMHAPFGPLQLWDDEAQSVWGINSMPKNKIIVVSLGSPYLINEYFERVNTCINSYSNTSAMLDALVKALTGGIEIKGVSPVDLDIMNIHSRFSF